MRFCANGLVVLHICATLEGSLIDKVRFIGSIAFSLMLLYTYKPGVCKLVQWKSHLWKTKNTSEPQNQFVVLTQIR